MRVLCAPMAAITHAAFRTVVSDFGDADEYYSEMIGAGAFVSGGQYEKWYVIADPAPDKMVWQVVGGNIAHLAEAAGRLARLPGIGVDINMGCSAPDILRAGAGAAWLDRDMEEMRRMVRTVHDAVKGADSSKRLSVKMRLGGKEASEERLAEIVRVLCGEGVERIAIHARSEGEKYRTAAHWEAAEKTAAAIKSEYPAVSVALNGDIKDWASMTAAMKAAPHADCVMIGRAAAVKPWVFAQLKADMAGEHLTLDIDRERVAEEFIERVKQYQPKDFWQTRIKRFFAYYAQGFSFAHYFATQMTTAHCIEEAVARLHDYFRRQPADKELHLEGISY